MQWAKVLGGLGALVLAAGSGAAIGVASRPSPARTAVTPAGANRPVGAHGDQPAGAVTPKVGAAGASAPTALGSTATPVGSTKRSTRGAASTSRRRRAATSVPPTTIPPVTFTTASPADPNVAALTARLAPIVAADPGCLEVTQGSQVLFQNDDTALLAPGSTQKLLVAAAALRVLGPDYTFTTQVVVPAAPVKGTVSQLWLVGGGDPLLGTPAFGAWWDGQARFAGDPITNIANLATLVHAAGVTNVTGGVHGDDARYDAVRLNPTWPADTLADFDIAPMSALTLNEGYQSWSPTAVVPADPASFAASTFAQLLTAAGVNAPDNPPGTDGTPPLGSVVIASIQSAPLSQIIGAMLRPSDNQIAELLVKELGYHESGLGTTDGGLAVVKSTDIALGIPWDGTTMLDGSGLDHGDRTTCQTLLAALYLGDRPGFSAIPEGMAVAGQSGTLVDRFTTAPLAGHMHAKTGSIDNAASLVGEIDIGAPVRFAMVFNQPASDSQLLEDEDDAVAAIAPYP
jgi:serine-type D-Ala-D-Ala carboxypeptidase/endopeptidase (penicillin-binding protein 4)